MKATQSGNETGTLEAMTEQLREAAERVYDAFRGCTEPTDEQEAAILVNHMQPGDFELARRAHEALIDPANDSVSNWGYVEASVAELLELLRDYVQDFGGWAFEKGAWRKRSGVASVFEAKVRLPGLDVLAGDRVVFDSEVGGRRFFVLSRELRGEDVLAAYEAGMLEPLGDCVSPEALRRLVSGQLAGATNA